MRTGIIYAHRNKINGKYYIGQTVQKNPSWRWNHGKGYSKNQPKFWGAIQKYGWENFEHLILEEDIPEDLLDEKETYWIKKYNANNPKLGYNILAGGKSTPLTQKQKKIRADKLAKWRQNNPEASRKSIEAMQNYWKEHPDEKKEILKKAAQAGKEYWQEHPDEKKKVLEKMHNNAREIRSKQVICLETQEVFFSAREASLKLGLNPASISKACTGKVKTAKGHHWQYISREEYEEKCKSKKETE